VLEGRYGPYVTDGELNASIPKGTDPATLSLDEARALLEARRGAPPSARRGRRAAAGRPTRGRRHGVRTGDDGAAAAVPVKSTSKAKAKAKAKPKAAARKAAVRKRAS
jgi:DNA topoisomerase-1